MMILFNKQMKRTAEVSGADQGVTKGEGSLFRFNSPTSIKSTTFFP